MTIQLFAYFKRLFKLYFATDLEEQFLSHANKPRHKSGGYKLREKRKQNKASRSQGCAEAGGWGNLSRGGGNLPATSQTTILSAHQTEKHYITLSQ